MGFSAGFQRVGFMPSRSPPAALCAVLPLTPRWGKQLPCRIAKPSFSPFLSFFGGVLVPLFTSSYVHVSALQPHWSVRERLWWDGLEPTSAPSWWFRTSAQPCFYLFKRLRYHAWGSPVAQHPPRRPLTAVRRPAPASPPWSPCPAGARRLMPASPPWSPHSPEAMGSGAPPRTGQRVFCRGGRRRVGCRCWGLRCCSPYWHAEHAPAARRAALLQL